MTKEITANEYIKALTSPEVIAMLESKERFIVLVRAKCCNKVIPISLGNKLAEIMGTGSNNSIIHQGMHCNKVNKTNMHKICTSCDVVMEPSKGSTCPICSGEDYKFFSDEASFEFEVTFADMHKSTIYLDGVAQMRHVNKNMYLRGIKPGCYTGDKTFHVMTDNNYGELGTGTSVSSLIKPLKIKREFSSSTQEQILKAKETLKNTVPPPPVEKPKTRRNMQREAPVPVLDPQTLQDLNEMIKAANKISYT